MVDTNVLISAVGWNGNERALLTKIMDGEVRLLSSADLLAELIGVASRNKFSFIDRVVMGRFLISLIEISEMVVPSCKIDVIRSDPSDNMVLECAVEGNADLIISGDAHLLELGAIDSIPSVTASDFLDIVNVDE